MPVIPTTSGVQSSSMLCTSTFLVARIYASNFYLNFCGVVYTACINVVKKHSDFISWLLGFGFFVVRYVLVRIVPLCPNHNNKREVLS